MASDPLKDTRDFRADLLRRHYGGDAVDICVFS